MQAGLDKAFCASFNQQKVLFTRTQRKQHFATKRELLQKRGRHMACCSGQNDGIERCCFRQTQCTIGVLQPHPELPDRPQVELGARQ